MNLSYIQVMGDVHGPARDQVVHGDDLMSIRQQTVAQMGT